MMDHFVLDATHLPNLRPLALYPLYSQSQTTGSVSFVFPFSDHWLCLLRIPNQTTGSVSFVFPISDHWFCILRIPILRPLALNPSYSHSQTTGSVSFIFPIRPLALYPLYSLSLLAPVCCFP